MKNLSLTVFSLLILGMIIPIHAQTFESADSENYLFLEINEYTVSGLLQIDGKITSINSDIKFYNNGNFKIRALHDRLLLFGSFDKMQVAVLDLNERQRIVFDLQRLDPIPQIPTIENKTETIDSTSAELERLAEWRKQMAITNMPLGNYTNTLEDLKITNPDFGLGIQNDFDDTVTFGNEMTVMVFVNNIMNNHDVKDALVKIEIIRDDFVLYTFTEKTGVDGKAWFYFTLDYPLIYPTHCFDMKFTASYQNYTTTHTEDFFIDIVGYNGYELWIEEVDLDWVSQTRYDHLPEQYINHPRDIKRDDIKCNE